MKPAGAPFWVAAESDAPSRAVLLRWAPWTIVAALVCGDAALFSWLSVARHLAFQSHAFDLGHMDQAVWNTLHGHPLRFTDMPAGRGVLTSRLAIHVEPLLLPLAPLYLIHSGPETLLVVQAVVVALGAVPAYGLALRVLGAPWLALVFPAAYLLHPSLQNAVLDDFHAVTLSACFLLAALYFLYRGAFLLFAVSAIAAAATKEEVALLVAVMGLALLARRRWYAGFMTVICSLGWFAVSVLWIIPGANPAGHSPYLSRYDYLGHGLAGVVLSPLRHPGLVIRTLAGTPRLDYLEYLLHPLGFVPVIGLPVLLMALPALLINMLSSDSRMYSGFYQYSVEILPYVVGAAIAGIGLVASRTRAAGRRSRLLAPVLCVLVLGASVVDSWEYGFSPLARGYVIPSTGAHQALEARLLKSIPSNVVVAAADEIQPHLSDRYWVYTLPVTHPANGPAAQYVALDASIPALPVEPHTLHAIAAHLLATGYGVQRASDGVLILSRTARMRQLPASFYSFALPHHAAYHPLAARWGPLELLGYRIHPSDGTVNRSRPAIEVETYWEASRRLPATTRLSFLVSPVYAGNSPAYSAAWQRSTDSPTLDWLPPRRWPANRPILVASLPFTPPPYSHGTVELAVQVGGAGSLRAARSRLVGNDHALPLGTITVQG